MDTARQKPLGFLGVEVEGCGQTGKLAGAGTVGGGEWGSWGRRGTLGTNLPGHRDEAGRTHLLRAGEDSKSPIKCKRVSEESKCGN